MDIVFSYHVVVGLFSWTIWFLYLGDNPAVEVMILVAAVWKINSFIFHDGDPYHIEIQKPVYLFPL